LLPSEVIVPLQSGPTDAGPTDAVTVLRARRVFCRSMVPLRLIMPPPGFWTPELSATVLLMRSRVPFLVIVQGVVR
jgi:hypothetical protein